MHKLNWSAWIRRVLVCAFVFLATARVFCPPYMKMNPPPDVDKTWPIANDNSCWMATAANMLAGAGYGDGTTVQARANDIYQDLITWRTSAANPTGVADGGWTNTALEWWLSSANNTWATNPYTVVTTLGSTTTKVPWADVSGAQTVANELRRCQFVGLGFRWPVAGATVGAGGHAITAWGDNVQTRTALTSNPARVRVSDSDRDGGGDVQEYVYDVFTNPNPGGVEGNEGNGWYVDYSTEHPYLSNIWTLCPTDDPSDDKQTQKVVGSFKIHQTAEQPATDLHYRVGTDVRILSYETEIDWENSVAPTITEDANHQWLTVDWDLAAKPVPAGTWVTITTEFVLPSWNAMSYSDIHFTYPKGTIEGPKFDFEWQVLTPKIEMPDTIKDVTGGYVIGRFDLYDLKVSESVAVGEYSFIHQYSYTQNPEQHALRMSGKAGYVVKNIRLGHSYALPNRKEMWKNQEWMTVDPKAYRLSEKPVELKIDWKGRLPYPKGMDIRDVQKYIQERK